MGKLMQTIGEKGGEVEAGGPDQEGNTCLENWGGKRKSKEIGNDRGLFGKSKSSPSFPTFDLVRREWS